MSRDQSAAVAARRAAPGCESGSRSRTRGEIQALRAVAVMLVVLFHFWPGRVPGGYIGVDVFFVISGFLITGHLLREVVADGRVSLGRFWARRARRLLPAAYLVIGVSAVATLLFVPSTLWQQWLKESVGSTLYVENWVLAFDAVDYLAAENAPSAVQHYWTLSVEEQFYLVWPLLVILGSALAARTGRARHRMLTAVLAVATAGSFAFSLWITEANPSAAYFVTPARAWQFGVGALLAAWTMRTRSAQRAMTPTPAPALRAVVSWAGLVALLACGLLYDADTPFPGTAAVLPVLATVAIIWAGTPRVTGSPAPLMSLPPVRFLGDISYSLYLWHWPPLVILPLALDDELGLLQRSALLVAVVAVSAATKKWVEDPARFTRRFGLRQPAMTLRWTIAGMAVLVALSGTGWAVVAKRTADDQAEAARLSADSPPCFGAASMDPERECVNPELATMLVPSVDAVADDFADYPECWVDVDESELKDCSFGRVDDPAVPHVVLIGDSHARAMLPAFIALAEAGKISVTPQLKATCSWTTGVMDYDDPQRSRTCQDWKSELGTWLVDHAESTDLVVTTGYVKMLSGDRRQQVREMTDAWRPVVERGVPIAAITDNPWHKTGPSACLEKLDRIDPGSCATSREAAFPFYDTFAAAAAATPTATSLDLTDYYCDETTCPSVIGGVNVYRDNSHLTITYTETLAPYLLRELRARKLLRT